MNLETFRYLYSDIMSCKVVMEKWNLTLNLMELFALVNRPSLVLTGPKAPEIHPFGFPVWKSFETGLRCGESYEIFDCGPEEARH